MGRAPRRCAPFTCTSPESPASSITSGSGRVASPSARARKPRSTAATVAAVERGFRALALGEATLPDPLVMELAGLSGEVHVKGAHLRGARPIVLKLATGVYGNQTGRASCRE